MGFRTSRRKLALPEKLCLYWGESRRLRFFLFVRCRDMMKIPSFSLEHLCIVVLHVTLESVDKILQCDYLNESSSVIRSKGTVLFFVCLCISQNKILYFLLNFNFGHFLSISEDTLFTAETREQSP